MSNTESFVNYIAEKEINKIFNYIDKNEYIEPLMTTDGRMTCVSKYNPINKTIIDSHVNTNDLIEKYFISYLTEVVGAKIESERDIKPDMFDLFNDFSVNAITRMLSLRLYYASRALLGQYIESGYNLHESDCNIYTEYVNMGGSNVIRTIDWTIVGIVNADTTNPKYTYCVNMEFYNIAKKKVTEFVDRMNKEFLEDGDKESPSELYSYIARWLYNNGTIYTSYMPSFKKYSDQTPESLIDGIIRKYYNENYRELPDYDDDEDDEDVDDDEEESWTDL